MKNCKILSLLLVSASCSAVQMENSSNFKDFMKPLTEKLHRSSRSFADWAEYYSKVCMHNLSDWVNYSYLTAKDKTQAFTDLIQDENTVAFNKLTQEEQEAIRSLNNFYRSMSQATQEQKAILVKNFSQKWKDCQRVFKQAAEEKSTLKNDLNTIGNKLNKSAHNFADWAEYYAHACSQNLSDWVHYQQSLAKNHDALFKKYIQDEKDASFKKLYREERKALKDLNNFYRKMDAATSKAEQEFLIEKFATKWNKYQQTFNRAKGKIN
jgi:hypothetical protein